MSAHRRHERKVVAISQVGLCEGGGSHKGEGLVALQGAELSGGRTGGTCVSYGQGITTRQCGEARVGGRAKAETPNLCSERAALKLSTGQRDVAASCRAAGAAVK